jgi:hypothetical protein
MDLDLLSACMGPQDYWVDLHAMMPDIADTASDEDMVEQAFRLLHLFDEMRHAMTMEARRNPAGDVVCRAVCADLHLARERVRTTLTASRHGKRFRRGLELAAAIAVRAGRAYFDYMNRHNERQRTLTDGDRSERLYDLEQPDRRDPT